MNSITNYKQLLKEILHNIETYSGTHSINIDKANQWIAAQPTKESKLAAQKIIDTTVYVTYNETYYLIEKLVKTEYKKLIKTNSKSGVSDNKIYMFIGENNDSNYFISILALYFIKQNGFREPEKYFEKLPSENYIEDYNTTLLYFDDMSYSGGQIIDNITKIYKLIILNKICEFMDITFNLKILVNEKIVNKFQYILQIINTFYAQKNKIENEIIKYQKQMYKYINTAKYCKIVYLLLGINRLSTERIENIDLLPLIKKYIYPFFDRLQIKTIILFKLKYKIKYAKQYPIIDDLCTQEELFYMSYFFSFGRTPVVSLYYDHKIANPSSTFLRALNFGPIVPNNFDIANYWLPFKSIMTDEGYENAINGSNSYNFLKYVSLIVKFYKNIEISDKIKQDINKPVKFIPFINNCYDIENMLNNSLIKELNYLQLISNVTNILYLPKPSLLITNNFKPVNDSKQPFISFVDLLYLKYKNDVKKINKILRFFINTTLEIPCNLSFYKNINYKNYTETKHFKPNLLKNKTVKKMP